MHLFLQQFIEQLGKTTMLEFIAVVFGIISVLCSRKESIWVYPTGIINTTIYVWLCYKSWGLYAEAGINFYYTLMSIYGWYYWINKKTDYHPLKITANTRKQWVSVIIFFVFSWIILYWLLRNYTNSSVVAADSFASATACAAMLQMAQKKLENWLWWIVTNLASIPLYYYKGAAFTSVQFIVFLILAILGWAEWRKKVHAAATVDQNFNT